MIGKGKGEFVYQEMSRLCDVRSTNGARVHIMGSYCSSCRLYWEGGTGKVGAMFVGVFSIHGLWLQSLMLQSHCFRHFFMFGLILVNTTFVMAPMMRALAKFQGHELTGLPKYPRRALHLSCSEARFGGVHFSGPPRFSPLMTFFGFFLLNLDPTVPNYPREPLMRSNKAMWFLQEVAG